MKNRLLATLLSALPLLALVACGPAGDDDSGSVDAAPVRVDAAARPDAPAAPDAAPMNPPSADVGKPCSNTMMSCPMNYICAALDGEADLDALCTTKCGETETMVETPPADGNTMCEAAYTGTIGVAACVIYSENMMTMKRDWYCGILCGQAPGTNGTCPGGLTCTMDLCID